MRREEEENILNDIFKISVPSVPVGESDMPVETPEENDILDNIFGALSQSKSIEQPKPFETTEGLEQTPEERFTIKPEPAVAGTTEIPTDPLIEEKYRSIAEAESPLAAGAKEAGLALTYGKSPISKYRQQEHPVTSTIGQVIGTVAPMLAGGTGITKSFTSVPAIAKVMQSGRAAKVAVNGVARASASALDYIARRNDELFSDDPEISGEAKKNLVINIAAAMASPLPETFLPKNLIQPIAQAATDIIVETIGQAATGDNAFDSEHAVNTIVSGVASALFGLADVKNLSFKKGVKAIKDVADAGEWKLSKEASQRIDENIRKSLEATQTPSISKVIEAEQPEFEPISKGGFEGAVHIRKPSMETELKNTSKMTGDELIKEARRLNVPFSLGAKGIKGPRSQIEKAIDIARKMENYKKSTIDVESEKVTAEVERLTKEIEQEPIEKLPVRKRGLFLETGGGGEKKQTRLPFDEKENIDPAKRAQDKFDRQRDEVRKKFVPTIKERVRNAIDFIGAGLIDREYYAKRLLSKTPEGDQAVARLNAAKGSSAEAKTQYETAEKAVSEYLPHDMENLFADYLQAKRTLEIETVKDEGAIRHTGGMTADEAREFINKAENSLPNEKSEALKVSAQRYWNEMNNQLTQLKDAGLINEESYKNLSEQGKNYSPRKYIQYIDPDHVSTDARGRRVSVSDSGLKSLDTGSEQAMVNNWRLLLSEVIARTQSRIFKNEASKELYNFVKKNPDNDIDLKEEIPIQRKTSLSDAQAIVDNLQGVKTKLEQRLKNPLSVESRLRIENKISNIEDKIDDLMIDKDISEVDTEVEITELQRRALDLNDELKKSETTNESNFYNNKIKTINDKIEKLSGYPKSKEITSEIEKFEASRQKLIEKVENPLSGTQIFDLEKRIAGFSEKINRWGDLIADANEKGAEEIIFNSKQFNKVPAGYERISTVIDGEPKSVLVPTKFAASWNASDQAMSRSLAKILNLSSGAFIVRPLATGVLAPEFALSNIPRDAAMQWLVTKEYNPVAPVALFQVGRNFFRVAKDAWTGEGRYRDYVKQGGGMEYLYEQGAILRDPTRPVSATTERNRQVRQAFIKLQEFSERLGRLALREQALINGKTPKEATRIAREYLDFAQGGSWVKAVDNAVPYLNASVQGTRSAVRAFRMDPVVASTKALQLITMGAGLAYTAYQLNPETEEKITDREKVSRWNFPLPFKTADGNQTYFSIPKDQSSRLFATIGEVIAERQMGKVSGKTAWNKIKMAFGDINPVDIIGFVPPTMSAIIGYSLNKDFWMRDDIWKGRKVSPHMEFYEGYTPKAFVDFASQLSKIGVEISPARAESALGQVIPKNPVTALMGGAYEQIANGLPDKDRKIVDKMVMDRLTSYLGFRKYFRKTYPERIDREKLAKKILEYKINVYDEKGRRKSNKILQEEVDKAEIKISDVRQMNDAKANIISQLFTAGDIENAAVKFKELQIDAIKVLGEDEVKRINERLAKAIKKKSMMPGNE